MVKANCIKQKKKNTTHFLMFFMCGERVLLLRITHVSLKGERFGFKAVTDTISKTG